VLQDKSVSRVHALISVPQILNHPELTAKCISGSVLIEDKKSRFGIRVNNTIMKGGRQVLFDGDQVILGAAESEVLKLTKVQMTVAFHDQSQGKHHALFPFDAEFMQEVNGKCTHYIVENVTSVHMKICLPLSFGAELVTSAFLQAILDGQVPDPQDFRPKLNVFGAQFVYGVDRRGLMSGVNVVNEVSEDLMAEVLKALGASFSSQPLPGFKNIAVSAKAETSINVNEELLLSCIIANDIAPILALTEHVAENIFSTRLVPDEATVSIETPKIASISLISNEKPMMTATRFSSNEIIVLDSEMEEPPMKLISACLSPLSIVAKLSEVDVPVLPIPSQRTFIGPAKSSEVFSQKETRPEKLNQFVSVDSDVKMVVSYADLFRPRPPADSCQVGEGESRTNFKRFKKSQPLKRSFDCIGLADMKPYRSALESGINSSKQEDWLESKIGKIQSSKAAHVSIAPAVRQDAPAFRSAFFTGSMNFE